MRFRSTVNGGSIKVVVGGAVMGGAGAGGTRDSVVPRRKLIVVPERGVWQAGRE